MCLHFLTYVYWGPEGVWHSHVNRRKPESLRKWVIRSRGPSPWALTRAAPVAVRHQKHEGDIQILNHQITQWYALASRRLGRELIAVSSYKSAAKTQSKMSLKLLFTHAPNSHAHGDSVATIQTNFAGKPQTWKRNTSDTARTVKGPLAR